MIKNDENIDISVNAIEEKAIAIKKIVHSLELRLRGYKWKSGGDTYIDTGKDTLGEELIHKLIGLLQPFCEESNLITTKDKETFAMQKWEINSTMNEALVNNMGCPYSNQKIVIKMFKSCLQNIGDIILGSKKLLRELVTRTKDEDRYHNGGLPNV